MSPRLVGTPGSGTAADRAGAPVCLGPLVGVNRAHRDGGFAADERMMAGNEVALADLA